MCDLPKISLYFESEDRDLVKAIPLSSFYTKDSWFWHYDKRGSYNVKIGYKLYMNLKNLRASTCSNGSGHYWKNLWSLKVPSKINLFLWKASYNHFPTNYTL